jgi:hypothetical protein
MRAIFIKMVDANASGEILRTLEARNQVTTNKTPTRDACDDRALEECGE